MSAGRRQASLVGLDIMRPVFPLVNVSEAEFPVLVRLIDALQESLSLFMLRQVKKKLNDPGAATVEMFLQIHDGLIPVLPNCFLFDQLVRHSLALKNFRMDANDQHVLVIGTIENADSPAFRQMTARAPEQIMFEFVSGRLFETENLATLRIYPGHDVTDGAVLAGSIHPCLLYTSPSP